MKKLFFFSILLAMAIWAIAYLNTQKEKIKKEEEKPTVIESQSASSLMNQESSASQAIHESNLDYRLRILTETAGADVFIDNEKVGQTPYEIAIPKDSKKLKLSHAGFEDYERQIPAAKDSEGDLVWKIQLKKSTSKIAVDYYLKPIGPFSLQIKAIPLSDFDEKNLLSDIKVKYCRVSINDKVWVRIVSGPFPSKQKALEALKPLKIKYPEAFLATKHNCLGEGASR